MRITSSRAYSRPPPVPKMPQGLVELMEGLSKEVLKNNPTDVIEFCAGHMEKLLEIRDGPSTKKQISLDKKIQNAQKKINQRAKLRRQMFDKQIIEMENKNKEVILAKFQSIKNEKSPVQVQDLANAIEFEISHQQHDEKPETVVKSESIKEKETDKIIEANDIDNEENENSKYINNEEKKEEMEYINNEEKKEKESIHNDDIGNTELNEDDKESIAKSFNEPSNLNIDRDDVTELIESKKIVLDVENNMNNDLVHTEDVTKKEDGCAKDSLSSTSNPEINIEEDRNEIVDEAKLEDSSHGWLSTTNVNQTDESICNVMNKDGLPDDYQNNIETTSISNHQSSSDVDNPVNTNIIDLESVHCHVDTKEGLHSNPEISSLNNSKVDNGDDTIKVTSDKENDDNKIGSQEKNSVLDQDSNGLFKNGIHEIEQDILNKSIEKENDRFDDNQPVATESNAENISSERLNSVENNEFVSIDLPISNTMSISRSNSLGDTTNEESVIEIDSDQFDKDLSVTNNTNDVNLEAAAITIQKVFRSFLFKSRASTFDDATHEENDILEEDNEKENETEYSTVSNVNKDRRTLGMCRMDTVTVLQTVNEEKSLSLSTDDSSTLSSAATTIQAHVRGFLVRNRLNSNKTHSNNSAVNSDGFSNTSLEIEGEPQNNKTILNIHIVPEGGHYMSRDESMLTSIDLSLDGSPPSSSNLHPLGYDRTERRKQLKREDAIQSISPPSNNSGKLSEDVESVKELMLGDVETRPEEITDELVTQINVNDDDINSEKTMSSTSNYTTVIEVEKSDGESFSTVDHDLDSNKLNNEMLSKQNSDEMDVVTPFVKEPDDHSDNIKSSTLLHSGECHDMVLPTKVSRPDKAVVSEFKNVLVYFLRWNA